MKIAVRRFLISAMIGALIAIAPSASLAEDEVSVGAKIFDVAVLRTLGTVKVFVGIVALIPASVLYTLRMPFNSDPDVFKEAAEMLVVEPANYVFRRPLGEDLAGD